MLFLATSLIWTWGALNFGGICVIQVQCRYSKQGCVSLPETTLTWFKGWITCSSSGKPRHLGPDFCPSVSQLSQKILPGLHSTVGRHLSRHLDGIWYPEVGSVPKARRSPMGLIAPFTSSARTGDSHLHRLGVPSFARQPQPRPPLHLPQLVSQPLALNTLKHSLIRMISSLKSHNACFFFPLLLSLLLFFPSQRVFDCAP